MKHEYWVFYPQGVRTFRNDGWESWSNAKIVHSLSEVFDLLDNHNAAYAEKIQYKSRRVFSGTWYAPTKFDGQELNPSDLWEMYKDFPEEVLTQ